MSELRKVSEKNIHGEHWTVTLVSMTCLIYARQDIPGHELRIEPN
jgi:hypothetical protein